MSADPSLHLYGAAPSPAVRAPDPVPTPPVQEAPSDPDRPPGYDYLGILEDHLDGDLGRIFDGELVYPRQLEFHLASDGKTPCNFHCRHCQGAIGERTLALDARKVERLIRDVDGRTEFVIFGGQYTEPTMEPLLMDCLRAVKDCGSKFGLTTNGSLLRQLEDERGFLTELVAMADDGDYVTLSLDAGLPESHKRSKVTDRHWFDEIIEGLSLLCSLRDREGSPLTIRVCYLLNRWNMQVDEVENVVRIAKQLRVDSLRFSVAYAIYGQDLVKVGRYRDRHEIPMDQLAKRLLAPYVTDDPEQSPYIFYFGPEHQDVARMDFDQCIHGYYQLTVGADGYAYRCSSIAQPLFAWGRLGKAPETRLELEEMIRRNQDPDFDCSTCFQHGARCNRVALENNSHYRDLKESGG